MVGTQQVGENARPTREDKRLIAVSILISHILLASPYLSKYKFIPTHLSIK
jgi:hypothetical protein